MRVSQVLLSAVIAVASRTAAAGDLVVQFSDEVFEYDHAHPAAGYWLGNLSREQNTAVVAIEITWKDDRGYAAEAMSLYLAALNTPCEFVIVDDQDDHKVAVALKTGVIELHFDGAVSDNGQRFSGSCTIPPKGNMPETHAAFEMARSLRPMSLATATAFTGPLKIPGMGDLQQSIVLAKTSGGHWVGHIDVPAQAIFGMPLINIIDDDGLITAAMPVPMYPATVAARIDGESHHLTGRFKQSTIDLELDLPRDPGYVGGTLKRPQQPMPPYPYESREVKIPTKSGFDLAGTLTLPKEDGPFITAVLITGSGQEDRDESLMGHKPFLVLADYLTRHGFAVLRCDDRGIGGSGGEDTLEQATTQDFADDVSAMVDFVKNQSGIDAKRVGLIGHSEGGLIGPMVAAARDDIAFVIMLAGPGVPGKDILILQGRKMLLAEGISEEKIEKFSGGQRKALELAIRDAPEEEIRQAIGEVVDAQTGMLPTAATSQPASDTATDASRPAESQAASAPSPADIRAEAIKAQYHVLITPWMKFFIEFDPRPTLAKVNCPVLALNGTLDMQVWHEQNLPEVEKAIRSGGGDVTIKRYEGLNHLFQPAKTGGLSEYAAIEITIDQRVLADIVDWLRTKIGAATAP